MSQNDRAYSEKRDFIRMRLEAPVILHHAGQEIEAQCLDLSSTGMQVEANCQIAVGDRVSHAKFGEGTIMGIAEDTLTVQFAAGFKNIKAAYVQPAGRDDDVPF